MPVYYTLAKEKFCPKSIAPFLKLQQLVKINKLAHNLIADHLIRYACASGRVINLVSIP